MRVLRAASLITFGLGAGLLVAGLFWGGNGQAVAHPFTPIDVAPSSPTQSPADTPSPSPFATATPTQTPYAGSVARLKIPRFNVDSAIESIGLIPGQNQLDVPKNPLNTGWYDIYDRPGWGGNAVFSAHVDYFPNIKGPFYNLHQLDAGDEIVVVMGDGGEYVYRLIRKACYPEDSIPMGDLIWPRDKPAGAEWVTLVTCGGRFQAYKGGNGAGQYLDRDVVVAERVR